MKIIHLIWQLKSGGAETMLVDIVNEQSLSTDVILIIGNMCVDESVINGINPRVKIYLLERPQGSRNPWYILKLFQLIRNIKADIIHSHLESFIKIIRYIRIPKVLTVHTTGIELSSAVNQYDAVYSISDAVQKDILNRSPHVSTIAVYNGIDFSKIKKKSLYNQQPFKIVQVSRLDHYQKGQDILLRALRHVNSKIGNGKVIIDFVGAGLSKDFLVNLTNELGIQEFCRYLGQRSRKFVYENLHNYDLLVQPSRIEGFGLTIVEAMAAQIPVLVSDIHGPMEVINKGKYGFFFHTEDYEECGDRIIEILNDSKEREFIINRKEIAAHAMDKYDVKLTAGKYIDEYKNVIHVTSSKYI